MDYRRFAIGIPPTSFTSWPGVTEEEGVPQGLHLYTDVRSHWFPGDEDIKEKDALKVCWDPEMSSME